MPNHLHGVLFLPPALTAALGRIIGSFKSLSTRGYTRGVHGSGWPRFPGKLWQRNYYERVIRNEKELAGIREYIANNPLSWELDVENPGIPAAT